MMCVFNVGLECVVTNWLSRETAYNPIRIMLQDNSIKTFSEFTNMDKNIVKLMRQNNAYKIFELLQYIKYINNNGDYDLAEDPTQWDKKDFKDWEITGMPEFANSSTPYRTMENNRIQSLSIAKVIATNQNTRIVSTKDIISSNLTKNNNSKEKELEEHGDFDTGMIHVLTRILKVPLNHTIAQTLQNDSVFEYLDLENLGKSDINWVYDLQSISKQDTVTL